MSVTGSNVFSTRAQAPTGESRLLSALKRLTLPGDLRTARPKRLRFLLSNTVGKVVAHARRTLLRLSGALQHALLRRVRRKIARLVPA